MASLDDLSDNARRGAQLQSSNTALFWQSAAHIINHDAPPASRAIWARVWDHVRVLAGEVSPEGTFDVRADLLCTQLRVQRHELEALFRLWPLYPWVHITFHSSLASRDEHWRWRIGPWGAVWDGFSARVVPSCSACSRLRLLATDARRNWDVHQQLLAFPPPQKGVIQSRDAHGPLAPRDVAWVFVRGKALLMREVTLLDEQRMRPHERAELEEVQLWVDQQERDTYQRRRRLYPLLPSGAPARVGTSRAAGPSVLPRMTRPLLESAATPKGLRCPCC